MVTVSNGCPEFKAACVQVAIRIQHARVDLNIIHQDGVVIHAFVDLLGKPVQMSRRGKLIGSDVFIDTNGKCTRARLFQREPQRRHRFPLRVAQDHGQAQDVGAVGQGVALGQGGFKDVLALVGAGFHGVIRAEPIPKGQFLPVRQNRHRQQSGHILKIGDSFRAGKGQMGKAGLRVDDCEFLILNPFPAGNHLAGIGGFRLCQQRLQGGAAGQVQLFLLRFRQGRLGRVHRGKGRLGCLPVFLRHRFRQGVDQCLHLCDLFLGSAGFAGCAFIAVGAEVLPVLLLTCLLGADFAPVGAGAARHGFHIAAGIVMGMGAVSCFPIAAGIVVAVGTVFCLLIAAASIMAVGAAFPIFPAFLGMLMGAVACLPIAAGIVMAVGAGAGLLIAAGIVMAVGAVLPLHCRLIAAVRRVLRVVFADALRPGGQGQQGQHHGRAQRQGQHPPGDCRLSDVHMHRSFTGKPDGPGLRV